MSAITKAQFAAPAAMPIAKVPLPECGPDAYACVKKLPARDLVELRKQQGAEADLGNLSFVFDLLSRTVCDDTGTLVFDGASDCAAHFGLAPDALEKLAGEVMTFSGLSVAEKN